jgi:hypothetical protein
MISYHAACVGYFFLFFILVLGPPQRVARVVPQTEREKKLGAVWHSSASLVELFFRKQLHEQLHEWGRESCFGSFTMC